MSKFNRFLSFVFLASACIPPGVIFYTLRQPGINENVERLPLDHPQQLYAVGFEPKQDGKAEYYSLALKSDHPFDTSKLGKISFQVGTFHSTPRIEHSQLVMNSGLCVFEGPSKDDLEDNAWVSFVKSEACEQTDSSPASLEIRFYTKQPTSLALWSVVDPLPEVPRWQFEHVDTKQAVWPMLALSFATGHEERSKWQLLNVMWGFPHGSPILSWLAILSFCFYLVFVSGFGFLVWTGRNLFPLPIAVSGFFLSIGLLYCFVFPPFQAPDEPDHFLGFLRDQGISDAEPQSLALASKGHFARIRQNPEQRFAVGDAFTPGQMEWGNRDVTEIAETAMHDRAPVTQAYWSLWGYVSSSFKDNVSVQLMSLRLLNIFLVTLSFFLFLFASAKYLGSSNVLALVFLNFMSSLSVPFFAMGVSNYPSMIATFFLCLASIFCEARKSLSRVLLSFVFGINIALHLGCGRTAVFTVPFLLGAFVWVRAKQIQKLVQLNELIVQIIFLLASVYSTLHLVGFPSGPLFHSFLSSFFPSLFPSGADPIGWFSFAASVFLLLVGASSYGLRRLVFSGGQSFAKYALLGLGASVFLLPFFSLNFAMPNIELGRSLTMFEYAWRAVMVFFLGPSPWASDFYVLRTFWVGFGWLDVPVAEHVFRLMKFLPFGGLFALAFCGKDRVEALSGVLFFAFLIAVGLMVLSLANHFVAINLHGRYLLTTYLAALSIPFFFNYTRAKPRGTLIISSTVQAVLILYMLKVTALAIIERYLG